jgi:DNA-binding NtrC family response regulator
MPAAALRQIEEGGAQPSLGTLSDLAGQLGTSVPELVRDAKQARIAPAVSGTPMGLVQIARAIVELPDGVDKLDAVEAAAVRHAFEVSGGNKSGAARLLGMQRKALERRLKRSSIGRG